MVSREEKDFKEGLPMHLDGPFIPRELEKLTQIAFSRKPILRFREIRSRQVPYYTDRGGKAYVDHHPELAALLRDASSKEKLKLL
jgi:hypothetical protein